ncbi:unnamed protein product [Porites evermanni]|uniref:PX domain-containing protein n=1 Tax=Porites evermanni TaxID=104178 RepID=A0ABN8QSF0_9CNID|nr:unnamed protein product [Porites evermanni]
MNSSNDTSEKETMHLSSEWNSSSIGHTRSSSYPGNITVVSEGSAVKSSRVNGQEVVFTEITKPISLPDNSVAKENIELDNSTTSGSRSFKFEDFLERDTLKTGSDTEGEGVQEAPSGEDTGNFVFEAADLFFNHPKVGFEEENSFQIQSDLKTSLIPTSSEETNDSLRIAQGSSMLPREDLPERKDEFCGENFGSKASSAVTSDFSKEHNLPYSKENYDSANTRSLAEKDNEKSNSTLEHAKIPGLVKEIAADPEAKIRNMPPYLNHPNESSLQADTQEHQDLRESPLEIQDQHKTSECKDPYKDTSSSLDYFDSAPSPEAEPSASDSKFEPVILLDSGESLVPVAEGDVTSRTGTHSISFYSPDVSGENDRDSLLSPSWSFVEDSDGLIEIRSEPLLNSNGSSVAMASDASTAAALAACSDAQRGMDNMASGLITVGATMTGDQNVRRDDHKRRDGMTSAELKQAMVSMMLRKDEIEEQNRKLQSRLDEECQKSQQLDSENEKLREEIKQQENFNAAKIASLSRENELLKHQLKKYVGAVQALRSDLQGNKSAVTAEVLSGIRQEEILPPLPPEQATEHASEEAEEYKRKLIQVADLHGELLEFNERLHKQVGYYQLQVRRLREELVNLRGPLPEDTESLSDSTSLTDFDPTVMSIGTRPLVNVWIPSVFLRGRSSNVHHVYQVYVRIKDDEWNIYRRYSQFFEMHKNLRRKSQVVESFKFPPKKTLGNKDSRFVEDRRRLLQDYLRRVVNLYVTDDRELRENTSKAVLLQIIPFFAEPFPPQKVKKESSRRRSLNYTGL